VKLLFDKSGELVVWSEGSSLFLSVSGTKYEIDGEDLDYFVAFVTQTARKIERERDNNKPLKQKLKELWGNTD
jgi:hypothetical protein